MLSAVAVLAGAGVGARESFARRSASGASSSGILNSGVKRVGFFGERVEFERNEGGKSRRRVGRKLRRCIVKPRIAEICTRPNRNPKMQFVPRDFLTHFTSPALSYLASSFESA